MTEPGGSLLEALAGREVDESGPIPLFESQGHAVAWVGSSRVSNFRCNAYLIRSGAEVWLLDPGAASEFEAVRDRVATLVPPERVTRLIAHHQDPDLAGSLPAWTELASRAVVHTTYRCSVLIEHYGVDPSRFANVDGSEGHRGVDLRFAMAPFLHSPGSFATYDPTSGFLFTGDIFAGIVDPAAWRLVTDDFETQAPALEFFHAYYMASNKALRHFVGNLEGHDVRAILPQHGSILCGAAVRPALEWLKQLRCGLDLLPDD